MTHFKIKTNLARAAMTLLALFLFLVGTRAQSSTLTVHDGTAKNQYVPIYGYYCDNYLKSEFIFPSTELTEMAGSNISEMTFYLETSAAGSWGNANFKVFLREVEATDFSNATTFMGFSDEDLVYEGALDGTGDTMVIPFTDSYYYTGGNLLVGIYNTVLGTYVRAWFYGEEVTKASVYNFNKTSLDNITSLRSSNFLPKTTFEYTPGNPPAAKPKDLAVNYTGGLTATVTWTSDAPSCDIDVNGTVTTGVTSPYTLTGLSLSTDYEVMVRANYGDGQYSSWTSTVSFKTDRCLDVDRCVINYSLIDDYGDGWGGNAIKVLDAETGEVLATWTVSEGDSSSGTLRVCSGTELTFQWVSGGTDSYPEECIYEITDVNNEVIFSGQDAMSSPVSHIVDCTLASCQKPIGLKVVYTGNLTAMVSWTSEADSWDLMVNDEVIENVTNPYTLTGLTLGTEYEVKVHANCGGGDYSTWSKAYTFKTNECMDEDMCYITYKLKVNSGYEQYGWNGSYLVLLDGETEDIIDAWTVQPGDADGTVTGATAVCPGREVIFFWYSVSANNDAILIGDISVYDVNEEEIFSCTGALTEETSYLVDCTVDEFKRPTDLATSKLLSNSVELSWTENGQATAWIVAYKSDKDRNFTEVEADSNPFTLEGLNAETTYTVKVRPSGDNEKWSDEITFTTGHSNAIPVDVVVKPTHSSATISWVGESDSYEVKYRAAGTNGPAIFFDDFENGLDQWTIYTQGGTSSGQTVGWYAVNPMNGLQFEAHSGSYAASAWSWNSAAINANNWLVTPQLTFGDSNILKFWVRTNQGYPDKYEVLLSTEGNAITDFTGKGGIVLQAMAAAPGGSWTEVSIDLSEYAGQKGYIAIHHQDYDANYLLIDDFGIYGASIPAGEWITIETDDTSVEITGLEMNTEYEYQIIGIKDKTPNEGTALATFTTLTVNDKVFVNAGNWDVDSNWFPAGVPAANKNAIIQADAIIPAGVVAEAKNITIDGGSITIKDGGQLKTVTDDLVVTFEKNIEAGKNYLLGFPINDEVNPANVKGLTEGNYGFYSFYSGQANEWVNSKAHDFSIFPLSGYSYSNEEAKTLSCTGPALRSSGFLFYDDLVYKATSTDFFNGFVMVGNPFVCTGYFTCFDEDGQNVMPSYFFKLNAEGTGFDLYYGYVSLEPGEAALLMYGENGTLYLQSDPIFTFEPEAEEGTYNIAALPELGQNTDQDANPLLELNFAAEGFATYYDSMYDIKLPAGMKARVVTAQNGADKLTYQTIADGDGTDGLPNVVPADTPVMLQIEPSLDAQTASVRLDFGAPAINTVNLLKGSDEETSTTGGDMYYKLTYSNNNDNFGWYWGAANGAAFTSPANKAWLALPASGARSFYGLPGFDGDNFGTTTGVYFASDNEGQDGDWYSVDGRKLNAKPKTKGVYILNGKKTVIR